MAKAKSNKIVRIAHDAEWRSTNVGRLIFNAARHFEDSLVSYINANGFPKIRVSHLTVTRNLDTDGNRLTTLAKRAAMTKQSMSDLVNQLEQMGLVVRRPDANDQRAKVITFTAEGTRLINVIRRAIALSERDLRDRIGEASFLLLRSALTQYLEVKVGMAKRLQARL